MQQAPCQIEISLVGMPQRKIILIETVTFFSTWYDGHTLDFFVFFGFGGGG